MITFEQQKLRTLIRDKRHFNQLKLTDVTSQTGVSPAFTITGSQAKNTRALLMAQGSYDGEVVNRPEGEPAFTITGNKNQSELRAFLMRNENTKQEGSRQVRYGNEPCITVTGNHSTPRAFVIGSQYGQPNTVKDRQPQAWLAAEPYFTVTVSGGTHNDQRAFIGKVVKLSPRALARFQSLPDEYILPEKNSLACEIIGNGAPCLLVKAVCEAAKRGN